MSHFSRKEVWPLFYPAFTVLKIGILLDLQYFVSAFGDRIITFKEPMPNKVLKGYVIGRERVPNEGSCRVNCYLNPDCVSINMGPLTEGELTCELNAATSGNEYSPRLKHQEKHTYLEIENPCSSSPCLNGGTCQAGFTRNGFRCQCSVGSFGNQCETVAKSCSHLKELNPGAESGTYIIDPDGHGALLPFNVTCNMTDKNGVGVTVISHDSENRTLVDGCEKRGCYSRDVNYTGASLSQLASLTNVSSHCEQFIKYECFHSVLLFNAVYHYGWWESRDSKVMTYWGGARPGSKNCSCGRNNSCVGGPLQLCNCDQNDAEWREDSGLLTDKSTLPVKKLKFGDVGKYFDGTDEKGYHTLGKFKCYGPGDHEIGNT
ncbi:neurexin-4-like [Acropora millepora]|uniref:neurexin-4-like n=1 Tax=Acropora millepora TaxID=45264 RepID=UPI001CF0EED0|nr:neurexin-4-like [Acropora millepora]